EKGTAQSHTRYDCYAVISVSRREEDNSGVTLAIIRLDSQGTLSQTAIDSSHIRRAKIALQLNETRRAWWRSPFRAIPLVNPPSDNEPIPPAFRVGATEARSPDPETDEQDKGAAGTMAISIPAGVTRVTRFRIAGSRNDGKIVLNLIVGGWNPVSKNHFLKVIVDEEINGAPFMETYNIEENRLDPEYQTLSLWLRGTQKTSISLVAVEFEFVYEEGRRPMLMDEL